MIASSNPYGDGHAAERIIQAIEYHFDLATRPEDYKPIAPDLPKQQLGN
jgi:UDP-N-acetylglucosamine 2-epimerase (non-hydrolysing)